MRSITPYIFIIICMTLSPLNNSGLMLSHAYDSSNAKKTERASYNTDGRAVRIVETPHDFSKRIALVIGNSNYLSSPLKNPSNDAKIMAAVLRKVGFEVDEKTNLGYISMNEAVERFGKRLKNGGVGLFYYAGHGMQVNGANYLIPVDARIKNENEVRYKALDVGLVLAKMEQNKSDVNIVILDACRDNPFSRSYRSSNTGLASIDAPSGTFIAYATAPGKTASDGDGRNGLYTSELVRVLELPGLKLEDVFKHTLKAVREKSKNAQVPWVASNLEGDFWFIPSSKPDDLTQMQPITQTNISKQKVPPVAINGFAREKAFIDPITGMEFVPVKEGCFQMGSTNGDEDEQPVHEVCISNFMIGKYEVTQGQWSKILKGIFSDNNPSYYINCGNDCPVENVSWNDIQVFISKLNSQSGRRFRLPTEAEWEYACRAGGRHDSYCGDDEVDSLAWYDANSDKTTHRVGSKLPNALGIHDMSGNVWEWVQDWKARYPRDRQQDPKGPLSGITRVFRGGSLGGNPGDVRSTIRNDGAPDTRIGNLGFRLVLED